MDIKSIFSGYLYHLIFLVMNKYNVLIFLTHGLKITN